MFQTLGPENTHIQYIINQLHVTMFRKEKENTNMDPFLDGEERAVYSPRRTTVVVTYLFKGTIFLLVNAEEPIQGQPMTRHTVWQDEHQFGSGRLSSSWLYSTVIEYVTRHGLRYEALRLSATCLSVQNWATFMESDVGLTHMVFLIS